MRRCGKPRENKRQRAKNAPGAPGSIGHSAQGGLNETEPAPCLRRFQVQPVVRLR